LFTTEPGRLVAQFEQAGWLVCFSRDGQWLATLPDGGSSAQLWALATKHGVRVYPSDPERLFELMCAKAGQNLTQQAWNDYIGTDESWRPTCPNWHNPAPVAAVESAPVLPQVEK
jgi:hypothetical protein